MRKNIYKLLISPIILCVTLPILAQQPRTQPITAYHVVNISCGKYLNSISNDERYAEVYNWWLAGFISGTNLEKQRATSTDAAAHDSWIKQYCEKNPLDSFFNAASKLNDELDKKTIKFK